MTRFDFALPIHMFLPGVRVGDLYNYAVGGFDGMVEVLAVGARIVTVRFMINWEYEIE